MVSRPRQPPSQCPHQDVRPTWACRLLYAGSRPRPAGAVDEPDTGRRLVELLPSQMAALRLFLGLAGRLRVPVAAGLAEQARTARCDRSARRWLLYLTAEQMESVAYGFWLHRMTGSAMEANHFARNYGITHHPAPHSRSVARL
ncbi:DUF6417 family protein [Streptomyces stelliscabiei]|nr:DUF6417 family protein [Streptomyces stelliscabiei]